MRRALRVIAVLLLLSGLVAVGLSQTVARGWGGSRQSRGRIAPAAEPGAGAIARAARWQRAQAARSSPADKQILFGDLHVHTTFSFDAFMVSLPMYQGEGAHPPADACDFARFCSGLDFWSINDHAAGLSPRQWAETRESIRECNALSGDPADPDLVSFLGWEWTQIGETPETHYGHKNVVLLDTDEASVPRRPIASRRHLFPPGSGARPLGPWLRLAIIAGSPGSSSRQPYLDMARFLQDRDDLVPCPEGVSTLELPDDCQESATTPRELFERLDGWGGSYLVIPHGNTWGFYTPPRSSWDRQLAENPDPERYEPLVEVFSGHGNSEAYRPWRTVAVGADGQLECPEPSDGYTPECWRAGEIVRERCSAVGEGDEECARREVEARRNHVAAGIGGHLTVPGAMPEDWLDSGQCTDCYLPTYRYRPGGSTQYALALSNLDDPKRPKRFRFGLIASSDDHKAQPGTGYKEFARRAMTDAGLSRIGPPAILWRGEPEPRSVPLPPEMGSPPDFERSASFFGTGGLVAVHSAARDRDSIWRGLQSREVYGTSGDRILLWFDWLGAPAEGVRPAAESRPMGSEVFSSETPRFRVEALGAFHQKPGCPDHVTSTLAAERLARLCRGDCHHPSDERKRITRIEVVRIRPQVERAEPIDGLIEDPWRVLPCPPDDVACSVEFSDPEYATDGRDTTYYVRAIQDPSPTINGAGLRCERDAEGRCSTTRPCHGDDRVDPSDDCLASSEERAWSSPIFLVHDAGQGIGPGS
ncbi:MAG: DUF3604 domain-containing protein [Deltaproteobacteria bacterium]|nr:DUF3604 domain-containing protein [Deltaproteobacteria bacterium]MBW2444389.1 DUF3604 domain-containing protein [Deltaproteobacteria bacterium]